MMEKIHATTVLGVVHNGLVSLGADGQATMGNTVAKSNVRKIRSLSEGKILVGFAGSTADAFTLLERFEEKLNAYGGNMKRAAIELAKDWRTDRYLKKLEAMMITASAEEILVISGTGDVLEPENGIAAIGSGGNFAQSAAVALKRHAQDLSAEDIVREGLTVAADLCIYTNHNFVIQTVKQ
ncbi:ATP-dependent protease subunit HslV [Dyadobacter tibetensis]|uniref:ATP-dependent protease subunit HslV n=1 Tax=Dyadobacter tibetensis TaxID=1211851 RepID=UPI00046FDC59|nr:ATP-dependent protease subunit HslV [Dyadobacter tibetensis]